MSFLIHFFLFFVDFFCLSIPVLKHACMNSIMSHISYVLIIYYRGQAKLQTQLYSSSVLNFNFVKLSFFFIIKKLIKTLLSFDFPLTTVLQLISRMQLYQPFSGLEVYPCANLK